MARYTEEQISFVKENYGKMKAKDIAIEIGRTIEGVYRIARKYGLTQPQNIEVEINEVQHQILVSGAIGDGRFKKNGKYNYYYSECHALGEEEYLRWKHSKLGRLTATSSIYPKNVNNNHSEALEFTTLTSPSLIPYAERSLEQNIFELNELGLLLLIFDDGWCNRYKSGNALYLSFNNHHMKEMELLSEHYAKVLNIEPSIIGIKRKELYFKVEYSKIFNEIAIKYGINDIDVYYKKLYR